MDMLNSSFGTGGMTCDLDQNILPYFIQNMKRQAGELPTKKAVIRLGKLEDGIYFLNKDVCVDADGNLVDGVQEKYVWFKKELVCEGDKIFVADIVPYITLPLSSAVLVDLMNQVQRCLKHNFIPALLVIAGSAMSFHYRQIVSTFLGCSMIVASGPPAYGKSTDIKAGLSLFGCSSNNVFVKGTNRVFLERSSVSSLQFGIGDPCQGKKGKSRANLLDIGELAVDLYNGAPTANYSTGILTPLSLPIVATNFTDDVEER